MADNSTRIVITAEDKTRQAFESVRAGLDGVGRSASTIAATVAGMAGLGGILSGAGIAAMVKQSIDAADAMNDLSQRIGIAVQDLAKYELAAAQSGTSMESIARGVKGLAGAMLEHGDALKKAGVTAKDADGAMRQLADLFARMPDGMEKTVLATKLFGRAGMDLIPMLNMGSKGLDESAQKSERYAAALAVLAPQADKFNDQMAEIALSGKVVGLTLANEVMPTLSSVAEEFGKVGITGEVVGKVLGEALAESFKAIVVLGANVAFTFRAVGTEIGGMAAQLAALGRGDIKGFSVIGESMKRDAEAARKEFEEFQDRILKIGSDVGAASAAATSKPAAATKKAAKDAADAMDDWRKKVDALLAALNGGKTAVDEFAAVMNRLNAKDAGVDASFWKDLQTLHAGYKAGRVDADAYAEAVRNLTNQQGFAKEAAKAAAEVEETIWKAREKAREEAERDLTKPQGEIEQQQRHNEEIGLTAEALAQLTDRRMQDAIATKEQEFAKRQAEGADLAELKLIDEQIGALEKLRQLKSDGAARQAVADAAKQSAEEWKRFSDDIERSLTDALMRGFESGNSFGKNFVDTLKNTLKTAALKVVVQVIVDPVMGGVRALGGGAGTGAGGVGNTLSTGKQLFDIGSKAYNWATGASALSAGSAALSSGLWASNAAAMSGSLSMGTAVSGLGMGTGVAGIGGLGAAGGTAAVGTTSAAAAGTAAAGGTMASLAAAAPYVLASLVVADAVGLFGKRGGPQQGQYGTLGASGYSSQFTMSGGDALNNQQLAAAAYAQAQALFSLGGKSASGLTLQQGYKLDPQGSAAGVAYRNLVLDGKTITGGTFDGNRGAQWVGGSGDAEGAATYLAKLTSAEIEALVKAIDDTKLTDLTGKLKANFGDLAVAMEKYGTAQIRQQAMLAAVLTEEEQQKRSLAAATDAVSSAFASLNLELPTSTAAFRDLIDGIDLTTQTGQSMLEQLDAIGPGFLTLAEAMRAADQVRQEWQEKLDVMSGKTTEQQLERQRLLASTTDAATKALMGQVWALEDQKSASEAAKQAQQGAIDAAHEALKRAVDVQMKTAEAARDAAQEQADAVRGVFDLLKDQVSGLYGEVSSTAAMNAVLAGRFIDNALSNARVSGHLPESGALGEAINAARGGIDDKAYASAFERDRDQLILAGKLSQLKELSVDQLTIAEQALKAAEQQVSYLEGVLTTAQAQLDALAGINGSVLSVTAAITGLQSAISGAIAASRPPASASNPYVGSVPSNAAQGVKSAYNHSSGVNVGANDSALLAAAKVLYQSATGGVSTAQYNAAQAAVGGNIAAATGWNGDPASFRKIWGFKDGGFHTGGLRLVGEAGPELEVTGPARYYSAPQTRALLAGGDNQELLAELRALREDNRAQAQALVRMQARMAKLLERWEGDGMPETRQVA